ncbi:Rtt106 domain-containing protein [Mycena chlorophos]|uniref:Rtt106 domain-containing protein n=1 Tax=Mycena chlorophos TaxID=658473 RepID=A0A8H6WIV0_MYCCL|nr:Rtt106 domain-containing protein [Mycena chlorophos]
MTLFLDALTSHVPRDLSDALTALRNATPDAPSTLDSLVRFVAGGPSPDPSTQTTWAEQQTAASRALSSIAGQTQPQTNTNGKRAREDEGSSSSTDAKRQKTDEKPVYTLHGISLNSPVRRKVDITVYPSSVAFANASTGAVESSIPLSVLKRAFLLPTRGKMKAHWTVVVLSVDVTEPPNKKDKDKDKDAAPQIIFGLDAAAPSALKYTTYNTESGGAADVTTLKSGTPTRDVLLDLIRRFRLRLPVFEPTPTVFRSACPGTAAVSATEGGVPGIEAYRGAKVGSLWFMRAGILWGESKPCEFWAVEDLVEKDALRLISATGRTCTLVITRKSPSPNGEQEDEEEDEGIETALTMIDGREQEGINKWVREHRDLFGKEVPPDGANALPVLFQDDSDEEDEDFVEPEESDGGSASEDEDSDDDDDDDDESGDEDAEGGEDAEGEEEDDDGELRPENHPLMRPGAMPKMSRATIDMVAAMMTDDLVGGDEGGDEEEGEDDELDD